MAEQSKEKIDAMDIFIQCPECKHKFKNILATRLAAKLRKIEDQATVDFNEELLEELLQYIRRALKEEPGDRMDKEIENL